MRCRKEWFIDCPLHLSGLAEFRRSVKGVFGDGEVRGSVPPETADMVILALHEALVNIIEHSGRDAKTSALPIRLNVRLFDDRMQWTFSHRMTFFSPKTVAALAEDGNQIRGYGLYIIDRVADRVRYYRNRKGESCVELVKWFRAEDRPSGKDGANV